MYKKYLSDHIAQVVFAKGSVNKLKEWIAKKENTAGDSRTTESKGNSVSGPSIGGTGSQTIGWREALNTVAEMDLWGETRREQRPEWRHYLEYAEAALRKPRISLPEDIVCSIIAGDLNTVDVQSLPTLRNKIVVFVSSTFTDTKAERNTLMRDVYPYLRVLCRILGLDFGAVDMRWGVNEETTLAHSIAAVCVQEVDRCTSESVGPAFLAILGHKYGFRPFPSEIDEVEYTKLYDTLVKLGEDLSILDEYFLLDKNMIPPHYVLKPRRTDQKDWWEVFEKLQILLRTAASQCLSEDEAEKYYISVTEQELQHGIFQNQARQSQVTLMRRTLGNVRDVQHRHRHILDVVSGEINEDSQELLQILKETKIPKCMSPSEILDFDYDDNNIEKVKEYVRRSCDSICQVLTKSILQNYEENLHTEEDEVFSEVLQHRQLAMEKCNLFVGREDLIDRVRRYIKEDMRKLYVIHGNSGCGKTALMAMCAQTARNLNTNSVNILRFLGTSATSSSARGMLRSINQQISRAYDKDPSDVPTSYKELILHFRECLAYATSSKPLVIFLDSLDQLSNEDFAGNLKWLSLREDLPANVSIVVSTLPGQCLDVLIGFFPEEQFQEVKPLGAADGPPILDKMLSAEQRTLTVDQRTIVLSAFDKCPLPLYLRLAVDVALKWHSYDAIEPSEIAADMPGLITTLFERLESKYGTMFVHHALAYITVAKNGLSVTELEDILSCDDDVLSEVFSFWVPPFIRIPPLLWIRIRNELGGYLVERGSDGTSTYGWYHRQFWETAEKRFVTSSIFGESFETMARRRIAEYFQGKWYDGKEFCNKKGNRTMENRKIASQPLVVTGNREAGKKFNRRKLSELSYQLLKIEDWTTFKELAGTLEFMEAKFVVQQGYECMSELIEASKQSKDKHIMALSKFVGSSLSRIIREPDSIYQLASQQVQGNPILDMYQALHTDSLPRRVIRDLKPDTVEDPCEITLRGHTSGIRSCAFSPSGELIASCAEDGSLRVWDAFSGAEIVTVTGLPGPTYPGLADPYHGERPCAFSRNGLNIVTGSENGWIQIWDLAGAQMDSTQGHSATVSGVVYSPDDTVLATTSKDETTKFWEVSNGQLKLASSIEMNLQGLACDYSPDGRRLAVCCYQGFILIDTTTYTILASTSGFCNLNLSASFSPSGEEVASGGDNSSVTLWDATTGEAKAKMTGHSGWIWCAQYTKDGSKLLTCSSDRTLKVYDISTQKPIVTLGGHLHRLSCVSISPDQSTFVTGSLDFCLKVWDYQSVMSGHVPAVGGLHYTVLMVSPDKRYIICSQGWASRCSINRIEDDHVDMAAQHGGSIEQATTSPDSTILISLDTGHTGQYSENAVYDAKAIVSSMSDGSLLAQLSVRGPCSVACSKNVIIVGTADSGVHVFDITSYASVGSWRFSDGGSPIEAAYESFITSIACRSGSNQVATAAGDLLKVWTLSDTGEATLVTELPSNGKRLKLCMYSPDGAHLITSTINGEIKVWDATNDYTFIRVLKGHVSMMKDMAFSPYGCFLATVAVEMSLRIWDVQNDFRLMCVWYGPVNQLGFISETSLILGESTGNRRTIEFSA